MKDPLFTFIPIPSHVRLIFAVGKIVVVDNSFLQHTTHTIDLSFFSLLPFSRAKHLTRIVYVSSTTILIPTSSTIPYPGFRYTLLVPTVKWVHFFVPKTIGILFSTGAI